MPEVERAVAAGRVAHVGRKLLARRQRHLPTCPRSRRVEQQRADAQDQIEVTQHNFSNAEVILSAEVRVQSDELKASSLYSSLITLRSAFITNPCHGAAARP